MGARVTKEVEAIRMTLVDMYAQWGAEVMEQVKELLQSRLTVKLE